LLIPQAALAYWHHTRFNGLKASEQVLQFVTERGFLLSRDDYVLSFPEKLMKLLGLIINWLVIFHEPSTLDFQ
jgi:hypothetical protein